MRRFAQELNLISPRTQRRLVINPRRFRFSIAAHMAEEGAVLAATARSYSRHTSAGERCTYRMVVCTSACPINRCNAGKLTPAQTASAPNVCAEPVRVGGADTGSGAMVPEQ